MTPFVPDRDLPELVRLLLEARPVSIETASGATVHGIPSGLTLRRSPLGGARGQLHVEAHEAPLRFDALTVIAFEDITAIAPPD